MRGKLKRTLYFKGLLALPLFAAALLLLVNSARSADHAPLYRIQLDDEIINPVSAEYIIDAIDRAEADGAQALIVELDTPGGLLTSTRTIVKRIMNATVPIIVYVAPKGSRAGSAGVFITLAANIAAMAPSTNIGAAHPVNLGGRRTTGDALRELAEKLSGEEGKQEGAEEETSNESPPEETGSPMEEKLLNDTTAWVESIARERGRNVDWALRAVTESVSATDAEAQRLGVIDLIAEDIATLVAALDGRTVELPAGTVTLQTKDAPLTTIEKTFRLRWLTVLAHPNIAYILMMLGFYGLLFEFTNPGVGFPGVAGAICLILAFFGLQVLPTNYAGVALIALAIALFVAEVKVTSYGLLTLGGLVTFFLGSLILFPSPLASMRASLPVILAFTLATLAIALGLITLVVRAQRQRAVTGAEGLVGGEGEVLEWHGERGKVFVHGEIWNARANVDFAKGTNVRVIATEGMTLAIEKSHIPNSKSETHSTSQAPTPKQGV